LFEFWLFTAYDRVIREGEVMEEIKPDPGWIYLGYVLPARKIAITGILAGARETGNKAAKKRKS